MKRLILVVLVAVSVLSVGGWSSAQALAAKDSKGLPAPTAVGASAYPTTDVAAGRQVGITRVAIVVSGGPVAYTDQFRQDPPAIVIEFRSRNVIAALEPAVVVNSGIIKEIQSDYYPKDRRALKRLTLTLAQPTAYTIAQQTNRIVVDIETPLSVLPGTMSVGQGVTVLGIEARDTLIQRLKVMEGALQQAGPPTIPVASTPKPVVVTKPVDIPQPVVQPASAPIPASRKGRGGFGYGLLLGIGGTLMAVTGWRRRKKGVVVAVEPSVGLAPIPPIAQGTVVLEQLILKAMQRQGQKIVSSKAVAGVGTLWIVQKEDQRQGLVCLGDGGFLERKVLEQFCEALHQEDLRSGSVVALGAFTAPAQTFANEKEINLIPREEAIKLMEVELKSAALVLDEETLNQHLAKPHVELAQAQERIKALEHQVAELKAAVGAKETAVAQKERIIGELTAISNQSVQEVNQLKANSAEADQRLASEQEQMAHLKAQIAHLEEQLKAQASLVAEKVQRIQEATEVTKDTIQAVEASQAPQETLLAPLETSQEASGQGGTRFLTGQGQERRHWPRLDLSRHKGKGVLVRATSNDGEPRNGDARNLSAGGLCMELPSSEALADEVELKLFLPDRTKPIEAIGTVMWKGRGSRRRMEQLGIALSAINAPDQEAISQFVDPVRYLEDATRRR